MQTRFIMVMNLNTKLIKCVLQYTIPFHYADYSVLPFKFGETNRVGSKGLSEPVFSM